MCIRDSPRELLFVVALSDWGHELFEFHLILLGDLHSFIRGEVEGSPLLTHKDAHPVACILVPLELKVFLDHIDKYTD